MRPRSPFPASVRMGRHSDLCQSLEFRETKVKDDKKKKMEQHHSVLMCLLPFYHQCLSSFWEYVKPVTLIWLSILCKSIQNCL